MNFKKLLYAVLFTTGIMGISACGSDDDNGLGDVTPSEVPTPSITDKNGNHVRISKVGDYYFNYDENGKLVSFGNTSYGEHFNVENDAFTIKGGFQYDDATETLEANIQLNASGFISGVSIKADYEYKGRYSESKDHYEYNITYQYNSAGQLIKAKGTSILTENNKDYDYGEGEYYTYNYSESSNAEGNNTWLDGNLISSTSKYNARVVEDGESYNYSGEYNCDISYSQTLNPTKQFTYYLGQILIGEDNFGQLSVIGLFGIGSKNLPSGYNELWLEEDGEEYDEESNYSLSYTLNSNGTIASERRGYETKYYTYGSIDYSSINETRSVAKELVRSFKKGFGKFGKLHRSKRLSK